MLLEKINKDQLQFIQNWFTPRALAECLFSDFDNMGEFTEEKISNIRLYQLPFLSNEAIMDFDGMAELHKLNEKQKFALRKNVADIYNLGARKYGKSLITLKVDISLSALYDKGLWGGFYSIDEKRLRGVLDPVKLAMEFHPIFKMWDFKCSLKPEIKFYGKKNHWKLQGVNMTLKGKSPGEQFYQLHVEKLWGDEVSFETEAIYKKRKEALSEKGAVIRLAGMTDFTKHSPIGQVFGSLTNRKHIVNLPQYINPFWDEAERQDRIEAYGGENSIDFRVYVEGEIVEDGISEFDMDRIRECYHKKNKIKTFEIPKNRFNRFRNFIIVERPKSAERIFIDADIGESAGTEIIIHSEVGEIYNYLYNITLYNLIEDEQLEIFKYLIDNLQANVVGLDCGEALGRTLADHLEKAYSKDNVVRYAGAKKIIVGFKKDDDDKVIIKNGKPVPKEEFMSEWSVRRLKVLLYGKRHKMPIDHKFDKQFNKVISIKTGTRVIYKCLTGNKEDHMFDAYKVFAIAQWLKKDFNQTQPMQKAWGTGVSSWKKSK